MPFSDLLSVHNLIPVGFLASSILERHTKSLRLLISFDARYSLGILYESGKVYLADLKSKL